MARIAGIDLPRDKKILIGLTYIYGIGISTAKKIISSAKVSKDIRVRDLSPEDEEKIRAAINKMNLVLEGDLHREAGLNIRSLEEIASYRGIRHRRGLPVRGQHTKNNARTVKGPAKVVTGKKQ